MQNGFVKGLPLTKVSFGIHGAKRNVVQMADLAHNLFKTKPKADYRAEYLLYVECRNKSKRGKSDRAVRLRSLRVMTM